MFTAIRNSQNINTNQRNIQACIIMRS